MNSPINWHNGFREEDLNLKRLRIMMTPLTQMDAKWWQYLTWHFGLNELNIVIWHTGKHQFTMEHLFTKKG